MLYKTGKKPARPDAVQLKFASYFRVAGKLPPVPLRFGDPSLVPSPGFLGNDQWGDCAWADADHGTMMVNASLGKTVSFTAADALADYGSTGFTPTNPATDQGTDLQQCAEYRQKTGVIDAAGNRHKIDIYTALRAGELDELALAGYLYKAVSVGVMLPASAQDQFNMGMPWTVVPGEQGRDGHAITFIGRNSLGNYLFFSWGRLQAATPEWLQAYMDEGIAFIATEQATAALLDDFKQVTG